MKNNQLAINMIAKIVAFIVNAGTSFFLAPFLIKNVGREAYGFVGLANDFVNYAQIVTVALNSMAGRFVTISLYKNDDKSVNKYFTSVIFANIIIASVMTIPSVFIIFFINRIVNVPYNILTDIKLLLTFVFLNFLINIIGSVFGIAPFAKNRLDLESKRIIETNILKAVVLVVLFYVFEPSVWYIGLTSLLCTIYIIITNIFYTKKLLPQVNIRKKYFDFNYIKILLSSGIWNSFSKLSSILATGLNLLITNIFIGASAMGILSIAKTVPQMILSVFSMLASIFAPQLTISYAQNDFDNIRKQLLLSMKLLGMLACIPMSILFVYGDVFYKLWVPDQNALLLQMLSIISCFELVFALPQESLWNVFTATNKVKQSSIVLFFTSLLSIIITMSGIIFAKNANQKLFIIAGTSTIVAVIRTLTFLPIYGAKCLNFKKTTFYPLIVRNTISVVIVTLISFFIKNKIIVNTWIRFFIICIITAIIGIFINIILILEKEERKILKDIILNLFNFKNA
ncbi:lipopolysaccharide biosynthesis protein [Clostridium prolinivorans]|uniref:lipopolysaccharide biosynthesis protein n=1 Tax=Clostridium prolinivorans TaxID=2769420 RepID=UPI000FD8872C|nr:oligosaccharide flippase family protein [Clostridium prolinivorans]